VLIAAVVALVVVVAIGVALVLVDRGESTEPAGEPSRPVSQLRVIALPTLSYQAKEFTTEPGLNEIEFISLGGSQTLTFADPALGDFGLRSTGRPDRGVVELRPGRDYVIHDFVPGHQQAGETATIHVIDGPPGPTKGWATDPGNPDYLRVAGQVGDGIYIKMLDTFAESAVDPIPAYGEDLVTLVGHWYDKSRFVPLGRDPKSVPGVVTSTTPPATSR
jgi:hypothetical protein